MNRRLFVLAALACASCATARSPVALVRSDLPLLELETLHGTRMTADGVSFRVASNGCTGKADWTSFAEPRGGETALAFARRRLDLCRGARGSLTELHFTWRELGLDGRRPVRLLNPVGETR